MKSASPAAAARQTSGTTGRRTNAGPRGAALNPPAYGIAFADGMAAAAAAPAAGIVQRLPDPANKEPEKNSPKVAPKLVIGAASDPAEREADSAAARIVRGETVSIAARPAAAPAPAITAAGPEPAAVPAEAGGKAEAAAAPPEAAAADAAPPTTEAAPASPQEDPAFQAVIGRARAVALQQGRSSPAKRKAAEAQAAAPGPANEVQSQAKAAQVGKMDAQQPQPFDRASFKAALLQKIAEITPKNLKEADEFKKANKAASIKGAVTDQVKAGKDTAQGGIKQATEEAPDTSVGQPKPVTPLPPTEAGPPPADLGATAAAPKRKSEGEVSLQAGSQGLDQQMTGAGVTEKQLKGSNEPEFQGALDSKKDAQKHAAEAPAQYRQQEQWVLAGAQAAAVASAGAKTQAMHGVRRDQFGKVVGSQAETLVADKAARQEVVRRIDEIYASTESQVKTRLDRLDKEVNEVFDGGAERAKQAFESYVDERMSNWKFERYLMQPGGSLLWIKDQFLGLPDEVNVFYEEARQHYITQMDAVIDSVSIAVETGLNEAKQLIQDGRAQVDGYVAGLDPALKQVGADKATQIQGQFDALRQSVDEKGNQLVDQLAQKYIDNLQKVDERIGAMKAENRGLVDKAKEQIQGVIDTVRNLKQMLLTVLAKAADAIDTIIKDPIGFLGNLIAGVKQGLERFVGNIAGHLQKGLIGWLFGAIAEAGIQLPEKLDLQGIIRLVLQILGVTYAFFRRMAVTLLGEPIVQRLEQVAEVFKVIVTEGIGGVWRFIKDMVGDIKTMVMDGIMSFVRDSIVIAGIDWIIGLLNPAAAFVKACKAIYAIIMFFVERGSQIMALVNAVVDSVSAIASGPIGVAAASVENALAKAVPVTISFLASLLGLTGISEKIRKIVRQAQTPVIKAIDWVIHQAMKLIKAVGGFVKGLLGGKKDKGKEPGIETGNSEHDAKVAAGLAAIDQEEQRYIKEGKITKEDAQKVTTAVKKSCPVFKSLTVVDGADSWDYEYVASPGRIKEGVIKLGIDEILIVNVVRESPPGRSSVGSLNVPTTGTGRFAEAEVRDQIAESTGLPRLINKKLGSREADDYKHPLLTSPLPRGFVLPPPPSSPILIDQAVITDPDTSLTSRGEVEMLGSKKPDQAILGPEQIEFFEITLDFQHLRGRSPKGVDSDKRGQLGATVSYAAKRFPNHPIIYNIITRGGEPKEVLEQVKNELIELRKRVQNTGPIQIILRR